MKYRCIYFKCPKTKVYDGPKERCQECGHNSVVRICEVCGSDHLAATGWCMKCKYG